jgi:hypothetical protein
MSASNACTATRVIRTFLPFLGVSILVFFHHLLELSRPSRRVFGRQFRPVIILLVSGWQITPNFANMFGQPEQMSRFVLPRLFLRGRDIAFRRFTLTGPSLNPPLTRHRCFRPSTWVKQSHDVLSDVTQSFSRLWLRFCHHRSNTSCAHVSSRAATDSHHPPHMDDIMKRNIPEAIPGSMSNCSPLAILSEIISSLTHTHPATKKPIIATTKSNTSGI